MHRGYSCFSYIWVIIQDYTLLAMAIINTKENLEIVILVLRSCTSPHLISASLANTKTNSLDQLHGDPSPYA